MAPLLYDKSAPCTDRCRVAVVCCGMEKTKRGFEAYARDLFEFLKRYGSDKYTLIKGSGPRRHDEKVVASIHRDSTINAVIARLLKKQRIFVEFASFNLSLAAILLKHDFDVMYILEASIYKFLVIWRRLWNKRFKLIHFTGGHLRLIPASPDDYLHHLTPVYIGSATEMGFRAQNQFLIPHFFDLPPSLRSCGDPSCRFRLRAELGVSGTKVVLSVGNLDTSVKRMDYVIREVAELEQSTFLLLIGPPTPETELLFSLATRLLGQNRFRFVSGARHEVLPYYAAADVFVLASLKEGFPLVLLEALTFGLPIVAHDYDVTRYILNQHGYFTDLSVANALASTLAQVLGTPMLEAEREARRRYARQRFSVAALKQQYLGMFEQVCCAQDRLRHRRIFPVPNHE